MEISEQFLKMLLCNKYFKFKSKNIEIEFTKADNLTPDKLIEIAEWWKLRYKKET